MRTTLPFRFTTVFLTLLSLALVVFGILNFEQRRVFQLPDDGVSWVDTAEGVAAWIVAPDSPAERAGIKQGDIVQTINGVAIRHATDAARQVFQSGIWSNATYQLGRQGQKFQTELIIAPQYDPRSLRHYLELVGLIYLVIGTFILVRRWTAPKALHFYVFCLTSFVLYTFSYTGKLNLFDWTIYWLNVIALILQPALFLHFCMSFPERPEFLRARPVRAVFLYLPAVLLLVVHVMVATGVLVWSLPLQVTRWVMDRVELGYLAVYFLAGAWWMQRNYRRADVPLIKQQLKWLTRGTFLAIGPFAALYLLPYFLGFIPAAWMKFSALALIFLPLTFGYAIVRYRLMDVDIIFQRGIAYTLATATIVGLSFGLIAVFADVFRTTFPTTSRWGWILTIVTAAFLFQPIVNWIQARLDKLLNRERYDYRRTLLVFARELTSERRVGRLLDQVASRLTETLGVDRVAIFLQAEGNGFRLAKSRGISAAGPFDLSFLNAGRQELEKGYLFFESVKHVWGYPPEIQSTLERLDLHYYLPFNMKDQTLGYLALGRTSKGDFLSTEDIDLLQTIASYLAVALENARLYESLEQKALQYQELRDFNESIIESISVGVLACDLEHRVTSWNSPLEKLYGLPRAEAVGAKLQAIFPPELLAELPSPNEPHRTMSLYKFGLRTPDDRRLIVNVSTTPLIGKDEQVIGRLLILNDITERVNLEDQLVQAEKLSSIGLLAAGVAHEVNTPLAVISSQAQVLSRQMPADDQRARTVEKIIKQSFRASEIVNNLLKFSRVSGSEHAELDLNRLIRETASLVEPMLRASNITLNTQLSPSVPPVYGNAGKLQQVFMNLIMNARDAMPRGGELTLASEAENSSIHVEVSDNGTGIPPDHLSKIFDPFFTTKAKSRGTGLGLAVTYGIIREHAGKIAVESVVGKGTTFRLEFPAARKAVNVG
ncbi:MAG: PAS domain S-box protein [Acidobacteriia bacterium]|nr:PAS domain S-box protein [Terriglobia bacterium]